MTDPQSPKIKTLVNDYTQEQAQQQRFAQKSAHIRHVHRRRVLFLVAILLVVFGIFSYQIIQENQALAQTNQEVTKSKQQLGQVKQTNKNLKIQVKQLNDPTYVEKLIRDKYYYSKSGEIIFSLPTDKASTVNANK